MNTAIPDTPRILTPESPVIHELQQRLSQSLEPRITNIPNGALAVLFSGGLDCTLLARLSHDILPPSEPIDLLNVAFENPRVAAAAAKGGAAAGGSAAVTPTAGGIYETCPDRITARAALTELQTTCPNRQWRLVAINIPYSETLAHREHIKRLMKPHNTEMDLSIACALYFAARGEGITLPSTSPTTPNPTAVYKTPAKVLLSGLGADELFSGYNRHNIAFKTNSYAGLIAETALDVSRLGARNLGRDDRVLSTWGREPRYPFLDERFLAWTVRLPIWEKCGFFPTDTAATAGGSGGPEGPEGPEGPGLWGVPEKLALRLVAQNLGLKNVACEKKRAIQFGARTAKMERGRARGTDSLV